MKLLQKILQKTYIILFIIYCFVLAGNTNAEKELPVLIHIVGLISTVLMIGKIIYISKGE